MIAIGGEPDIKIHFEQLFSGVKEKLPSYATPYFIRIVSVTYMTGKSWITFRLTLFKFCYDCKSIFLVFIKYILVIFSNNQERSNWRKGNYKKEDSIQGLLVTLCILWIVTMQHTFHWAQNYMIKLSMASWDCENANIGL